MNIGNNIKRIRLERGITQTQLSEKVGLFGAGNISQYENSLCNPSAGVMKKIADALGVTVDDLYLDDPSSGYVVAQKII